MTFWEDVPEELKDKIWEMLRLDNDVCDLNDPLEIQNEDIDDWINRNNDPGTIKELINDVL